MSRNTPTEVVEQRIANGGENEAKLKEPQKGLVKFVDRLSESDENSGEDSSALNQEVTKEIRRRRNTFVNSFRLAELVPTTNTPHSQYRRKSIAVLTTETVIDAKAEQQ